VIDPSFAAHRQRLSKASDHWMREHEVYRADRRESVINFIGSKTFASTLTDKPADEKRMIGNLIQLAGQARVTQLAYNAPRFTIVSNNPRGDILAVRGEEFLNRYAPLIGIGNVARAIALDSFFGYGIVQVDQGILPYGVQRIVGQQLGPMVQRISQDHFLFDGSASCWEDVGFVATLRCVPLDEARSFEPFLRSNPKLAEALQEFNMDNGRTDSRVHRSAGSPMRNAQAMTRLVSYYFPSTGVTAVWPANDHTFSAVSEEPLLISPWTGHHTGPHAVLSDLDIPDNLIPVPQMESTKRLHFLFNELMEITSAQALEAKFNPTYEMGAQRDMERWKAAPDREPIPVSSNAKLGGLEIPGPTQQQTAYQMGIYSMFKEFNGNLDDIAGLAPTAATAGQSRLIRSATSQRGAELRARMDRVMELVGRKLLHLAMNDQTFKFPMRRPIAGTRIMEDVSWLTPAEMPRGGTVDDFDIQVIPESMRFRSAEERLQQLNEATMQIAQAAGIAAQGVPLELSKFVETQARYRDLPELREWFLALLPEQQNKKAAAMPMPNPSKPNGEYNRTSTSTRTNGGAMEQAFAQQGNDLAGEAA
jgi:hypothetical protein